MLNIVLTNSSKTILTKMLLALSSVHFNSFINSLTLVYALPCRKKKFSKINYIKDENKNEKNFFGEV